jgi:23S rRNA (adenine2503-C2)-methyltransferase
MEMIQQFGTEMTNLGASIRIFNPAGQDDIGGGCGQLWYFQEWLKNNNI